MKRLVVVFALTAACAAPGAAPFGQIPLRNPTAPVASQSNVALDQLLGTWTVVQGAGISPGQNIQISPEDIVIANETVPFTLRDHGRLHLANDQQLWVHWLDTSARTVVLGDPNGSRVWIMDRSAASSPDRIKAAREILQWYGYDLTRIESAV